MWMCCLTWTYWIFVASKRWFYMGGPLSFFVSKFFETEKGETNWNCHTSLFHPRDINTNTLKHSNHIFVVALIHFICEHTIIIFCNRLSMRQFLKHQMCTYPIHLSSICHFTPTCFYVGLFECDLVEVIICNVYINF